MEEKQRSVSQHALVYGLITGVILIVFSLVLYLANLHLNKTLGYIGYIFIIGGMVYGTLEYRKKYLNGFMTYGKAFSSCFLIGVFAGILASVYMFFFAQFINPGFVQELLDQTREQMMSSNQNMTEEQLDQALAISAKFMSPPFLAIWGLLAYIIISAILSLIIGLFLKKEDKTLTPSV